MKNQIFKRLFIGLKKGYLTPTLPDNIIKFQSYPIIRLIRFLDGFSFLLIVSKNYLNYSFYVLYLAMFFVLILTVYHLFISFFIELNT